MKKNKQPDGMPVWFDGKSINEALFCEEFFELPLRGEIFEELKFCAVSNIPCKISNIVELMELAAMVEDFPRSRIGAVLSALFGSNMKDGSIGKPCGTLWRKPKPQRTAASPVNLWRRCL